MTGTVLVDGNYIKEMPKNPFAPTANATTVTTMTAADSAAADAVAADGDGSQGWYYDAATGFIRASGAPYEVAEDEDDD